METKRFGKEDVGCWIDSARGIYIGEEVINIAEKLGMKISEDDQKNRVVDGEFYHELWDEAESFLNTLVSDDVYFGSNPDTSDWGLWEIEVESL